MARVEAATEVAAKAMEATRVTAIDVGDLRVLVESVSKQVSVLKSQCRNDIANVQANSSEEIAKQRSGLEVAQQSIGALVAKIEDAGKSALQAKEQCKMAIASASKSLDVAKEVKTTMQTRFEEIEERLQKDERKMSKTQRLVESDHDKLEIQIREEHRLEKEVARNAVSLQQQQQHVEITRQVEERVERAEREKAKAIQDALEKERAKGEAVRLSLEQERRKEMDLQADLMREKEKERDLEAKLSLLEQQRIENEKKAESRISELQDHAKEEQEELKKRFKSELSDVRERAERQERYLMDALQKERDQKAEEMRQMQRKADALARKLEAQQEILREKDVALLQREQEIDEGECSGDISHGCHRSLMCFMQTLKPDNLQS